MFAINSRSVKCYNTIQLLCGEYSLDIASGVPPTDPTEETPYAQIRDIYSMMWPNVRLAEADVTIIMMLDEYFWEMFRRMSTFSMVLYLSLGHSSRTFDHGNGFISTITYSFIWLKGHSIPKYYEAIALTLVKVLSA